MEATRGRSALSGTRPAWGPYLQAPVAPPDLSGTRPSGPPPAGGIGRRGAAFGVSAAVWEQMLCGVFGSGGEDVSISGWRLSGQQQSRTDLHAAVRRPLVPRAPPHAPPCPHPASKPNACSLLLLRKHNRMSRFLMSVSQRCSSSDEQS